MAIINKSTGQSLYESELSIKSNSKLEPSALDKAAIKKGGFIATAIDELKKVQWPSFSYVTNWSLVIIIFTCIFALSIGLADRVFTSGIVYTDCSAKISKGQKDGGMGVCNSEVLEILTFRKEAKIN
jgi:preprotein translocase SecE subunit